MQKHRLLRKVRLCCKRDLQHYVDVLHRHNSGPIRACTITLRGGGSVPSGRSCTYDSECMTSGDTCQAMICTGGMSHRRRLLSDEPPWTTHLLAGLANTVNIGGACNAPEECIGAANCEYDTTTSTQKCKACPGPGECNNMAFVNPGEINCGILLEKSLKATVNDLVGGQNLETETAVSVGCPGNGCEVCPNGEYSAFTDITCLECPPGTSGRGVDGAVSLDDGCPACPESTIQPLSGQVPLSLLSPRSSLFAFRLLWLTPLLSLLRPGRPPGLVHRVSRRRRLLGRGRVFL